MRAAIALVAVALAGCSSGQTDIPLCYAGMPPPSRILSDPAFGALQYHIHQSPNWHRPHASDLWADAKFEYRTGLQYASAPVKEPKSPEDLCAFSIEMRFTLPPQPEDDRKLQVFAREVAPASGLDAATLEKKIREVLASGDKYRPRDLGGKARVRAGKLFHATRGDFFLLTFTWARPDGAPDEKE